MKVFLWILAGLMVLPIAVLIGVGAFYGSSIRKSRKDAEAFAAHATHADCADELARRMNGCEGISGSCAIDGSYFVGICLRRARDDGARFCGSVPTPTDQGALATWGNDFCPPRKLAREQCSLVTALVAVHCVPYRKLEADASQSS